MLNYEECKNCLEKRETKKIARNTYLRMEAGNHAQIAVIKFWDTDIVRISPEDIYTLNSGGYLTVTTKERLNTLTPARIGQEAGLWYVYEAAGLRGCTKVPFADGIRVDAAGYVVDGAGREDLAVTKRKVDRLVSKYIAGYAAHVMELGYPDEDTAGDCWPCKLHDVANKDIEPMGYEHYLSHFEEGYYVPSILIKAIQEVGYGNPGVVWAMMKSDLAQGREPYALKHALQKFFRARKAGIAAVLAAQE